MWNERLSSRQFLCTCTRGETVVAVFSQSLPEVLVKLVSSGVALCQPLIFHPWQKLHDSMVPRKDWWTAGPKMLINTLFYIEAFHFSPTNTALTLSVRPPSPSFLLLLLSLQRLWLHLTSAIQFPHHHHHLHHPYPIKSGGGKKDRQNNSKWDSNTVSSRPCHFWSHRKKHTRVWKQIKGIGNGFLGALLSTFPLWSSTRNRSSAPRLRLSPRGKTLSWRAHFQHFDKKKKKKKRCALTWQGDGGSIDRRRITISSAELQNCTTELLRPLYYLK